MLKLCVGSVPGGTEVGLWLAPSPPSAFLLPAFIPLGFFMEYHKQLPRIEPGYEDRIFPYQLYHFLNLYLVYGRGFRTACMAMLDLLLDPVIPDHRVPSPKAKAPQTLSPSAEDPEMPGRKIPRQNVENPKNLGREGHSKKVSVPRAPPQVGCIPNVPPPANSIPGLTNPGAADTSLMGSDPSDADTSGVATANEAFVAGGVLVGTGIFGVGAPASSAPIPGLSNTNSFPADGARDTDPSRLVPNTPPAAEPIPPAS